MSIRWVRHITGLIGMIFFIPPGPDVSSLNSRIFTQTHLSDHLKNLLRKRLQASHRTRHARVMDVAFFSAPMFMKAPKFREV